MYRNYNNSIIAIFIKPNTRNLFKTKFSEDLESLTINITFYNNVFDKLTKTKHLGILVDNSFLCVCILKT